MTKNKYIRILVSFIRGIFAFVNIRYSNFFKKNIVIKEVDFKGDIPKKIHQTYPDIVLPTEIQENIDSFKERNPEWEYTLYNDQMALDYITQHFPELVVYFQSINSKYGAAKADFFRYVLMYNEGGCYLDVKSTFTTPLDELMDSSGGMVLSYWENKPGEEFESWGIYPDLKNPNGEFIQSYIFAPKGHPYLKAVIELVVKQIQNYSRIVHGVGRGGVVRLTGPIVFSKAIEPIVMLYPHRLVNIKQLGYVYSIYDNSGSHRQLFKNHYSDLTESIVTSCNS
ncbi:MAG: glycosyltransferase [Pseudomonadota bacterium]|nr:glycosyltransferase [Pseudomonadota bacterium]